MPFESEPSISVALCTYNGARYVSDLLSSLAGQEHPPAEVVVSDDRSSDDTVRIIENFAAQAPFPVRVTVNEVNVGPVKNFERTIARCTSDLIALCDQDDVWTPQRLRRAVDAFHETPDIGFTFSDADLIGEDSQLRSDSLWSAIGFNGERRIAAERGELLPLLIPFTVVTGSTMTFRADLRSYVLPIGDGWMHDAWIAAMSSMVRPYALLPERLIRYRIHPSQEIGVPTGPNLDTRWGKWKTRIGAAVTFGKSDLARQRRRLHARRLSAAAERYRSASGAYLHALGSLPQPLAESVVRTLEDQARHAEVRGTLPDRRVERFAIIRAELKSGRYKRYSAGSLSALQDLLY